MVQPEYSPEEALQRVKLMMSYDSKKTLKENVESIKEPINEIAPIAAAIAWLAPFALEAGAVALASTGIGAWIYNTQGGGDSHLKTQTFFKGCKTNIKDLKPTVSKSEYRAAADSIYSAIEGIGTDEQAIKTALNSMPTVADLCALNSWYSTQYGDLYNDLDDDIDGTDFTKYVWSAIAPKVADAEDDLEKVKKGGDGKKVGGGVVKSGGGYKPCSGTYTYGCKSEAISKVQACIGGLTPDGKFGPKTKKALAAKGVTSFTDADITKICTTTTTTKVEDPLLNVPDDFSELQTKVNTGKPQDNTGPIDGYSLI
jgi:hypothetical protein